MTMLTDNAYARSEGFQFALRAYEITDDESHAWADLNVSFEGAGLLVLNFTPSALAELHKQTAIALAALHGESPVDGPLLGSGARW